MGCAGCRRACSAADGAALIAHYRDCVAAGAPIVYEERLRRPPDERWWQTSLTPLTDETGTVSQILGIAIDITERKRVESKLSATERGPPSPMVRSRAIFSICIPIGKRYSCWRG